MKIVATSDLHGFLPDIEPCDLLILAGDICPNFFANPNKDRLAQASWLGSIFKEWLKDLPAKTVVMIWGNHDFVGERASLIPELPCHILHDTSVVVDGPFIYGTPWTSRYGTWALMEDEEVLEERWKDVPKNLDILISHGPPYGYLDEAAPMTAHLGSKSMLDCVSRVNPRVFICGHIHGGRGEGILPGGGIIKNVAFKDEAYKPTTVAPAFELD